MQKISRPNIPVCLLNIVLISPCLFTKDETRTVRGELPHKGERTCLK